MTSIESDIPTAEHESMESATVRFLELMHKTPLSLDSHLYILSGLSIQILYCGEHLGGISGRVDEMQNSKAMLSQL